MPITMSPAVIFAVVAYALASLSALLLFRRSHNWRIRFASVLIVAIPLCEAVRVLRDAGIWFKFGTSGLTELAELAVAGLFLACVLVLKRESTEVLNTQERLRLAEAAAGWSTFGSPPQMGLRVLGGMGAWLRRSPRRSAPDTAGAHLNLDGGVAPREADHAERRSEPRFPADGEACVTIYDPERVGQLSARLIDVSKSGVQLSVHLPLPASSRLEVKLGDLVLKGQTKWCRWTKSDLSFHVGVRTEETTDGSRLVEQAARQLLEVPQDSLQ